MRAWRFGGVSRRVRVRHAGAGRLIFVFAAAAVLSAGCARRVVLRPATSVPEFRYPGRPGGPNLRLVSLLGDPFGDRFEQGMDEGAPVLDDGFVRVSAAAMSPDGALYVLDGGRGSVFRLAYDVDGRLKDVHRFSLDGDPFPSAIDVAVGPAGSCWVVDSRLAGVYRFAPSGKLDGRLGGRFARPVGIVYHPGLDRMLVTDLEANAIHEVGVGGRVLARHGPDDSLRLETPSFIAVGPAGNIYVVEALSCRVKVVGPDWREIGFFGGVGDGPGHFARPKGIAVDARGRVFVVDALFDNVQIFDEDGTLLLTLGTTGRGPAEFWQPMGISIDDRQRIYVSDSFNRRIQVFRWVDGG